MLWYMDAKITDMIWIALKTMLNCDNPPIPERLLKVDLLEGCVFLADCALVGHQAKYYNHNLP